MKDLKFTNSKNKVIDSYMQIFKRFVHINSRTEKEKTDTQMGLGRGEREGERTASVREAEKMWERRVRP